MSLPKRADSVTAIKYHDQSQVKYRETVNRLLDKTLASIDKGTTLGIYNTVIKIDSECDVSINISPGVTNQMIYAEVRYNPEELKRRQRREQHVRQYTPYLWVGARMTNQSSDNWEGDSGPFSGHDFPPTPILHIIEPYTDEERATSPMSVCLSVMGEPEYYWIFPYRPEWFVQWQRPHFRRGSSFISPEVAPLITTYYNFFDFAVSADGLMAPPRPLVNNPEFLPGAAQDEVWETAMFIDPGREVDLGVNYDLYPFSWGNLRPVLYNQYLPLYTNSRSTEIIEQKGKPGLYQIYLGALGFECGGGTGTVSARIVLGKDALNYDETSDGKYEEVTKAPGLVTIFDIDLPDAGTSCNNQRTDLYPKNYHIGGDWLDFDVWTDPIYLMESGGNSGGPGYMQDVIFVDLMEGTLSLASESSAELATFAFPWFQAAPGINIYEGIGSCTDGPYCEGKCPVEDALAALPYPFRGWPPHWTDAPHFGPTGWAWIHPHDGGVNIYDIRYMLSWNLAEVVSVDDQGRVCYVQIVEDPRCGGCQYPAHGMVALAAGSHTYDPYSGFTEHGGFSVGDPVCVVGFTSFLSSNLLVADVAAAVFDSLYWAQIRCPGYAGGQGMGRFLRTAVSTGRWYIGPGTIEVTWVGYEEGTLGSHGCDEIYWTIVGD